MTPMLTVLAVANAALHLTLTTPPLRGHEDTLAAVSVTAKTATPGVAVAVPDTTRTVARSAEDVRAWAAPGNAPVTTPEKGPLKRWKHLWPCLLPRGLRPRKPTRRTLRDIGKTYLWEERRRRVAKHGALAPSQERPALTKGSGVLAKGSTRRPRLLGSGEGQHTKKHQRRKSLTARVLPVTPLTRQADYLPYRVTHGSPVLQVQAVRRRRARPHRPLQRNHR